MTKSAKTDDHRPVALLLEVSPRPGSGGDLAPRAAMPEDFRRRAGEIADSVAGVADEFRSRLASVVAQPSSSRWGVESIEIGFEIAVQAETGVVIAKASSSATFSVSLTLQAPPDQR